MSDRSVGLAIALLLAAGATASLWPPLLPSLAVALLALGWAVLVARRRE